MHNILQQSQHFLNRAYLADKSDQLLPVLENFFSVDNEHKHIILKRSIIYFYEHDKIVNSISCGDCNSDENIYTFDGQKVARITPHYYIGSAFMSGAASQDVQSSTNNNNNNNNNNNGNNNG